MQETITWIYVKNRYINLNDIENPIKYEFQTPSKIRFDMNTNNEIEMKIRRLEVLLEDSLFPFLWNSDPLSFNSVEDFSIYSQNSNGI